MNVLPEIKNWSKVSLLSNCADWSGFGTFAYKEFTLVYIVLALIAVAGLAFHYKKQSQWRDEKAALNAESKALVSKLEDDNFALQKQLSDIKQNLDTSQTKYIKVISETLDTSANDAELTSADMESVIAGVTQVYDHLQIIKELAFSSAEKASEGIDKSRQVDELLFAVSQSKQDLEQMLTQFSEINEKTEAIRHIGEEAEMLALNAAIEAARAGEAGRGFAVVADNMKELAKKSQDTSVTILDITQQSNKKTEAVTRSFAERSEALTESVSELVINFKSINNYTQDIEKHAIGLSSEAQSNLQTSQSVAANVKTSVETLVKKLSQLSSTLMGKEIVDMTPAEAHKNWQMFDEVIDVRREKEWNDELGHIPNITFKTLQTDFKEYVSQLTPEKTYLFVCRSGGRSTKAAQMAMTRGIANVYNLEGGMLEWRKQGL